MIGSPDGRPRTRQTIARDVPEFDVHDLDQPTRAALAELLVTIADDEFVLGFWDSEWTGIAPMLEEDVAFSSLAQDEIGHARVLYEMIARLTGGDADDIAFGRPAEAYRHCRLVDHPRTDWAFSVCRRWLYDLADSIRLSALARSSFRPLADVVAKIRREETYHLMHMDAWMRRLASSGLDSRVRAKEALDTLWVDASTPFARLPDEALLIAAGILEGPLDGLADRHRDMATDFLRELDLQPLGAPSGTGGRQRPPVSTSFAWLWNEFTMVRRQDETATW